MPLVSKAVANLIGGVSQQASKARFQNMADESVNTWPTVLRGLDKRRPTEHLGNLLSTAAPFANGVRFHVIRRDAEERYALFMWDAGSGQTGIMAYDLIAGEEVKVFTRFDNGDGTFTYTSVGGDSGGLSDTYLQPSAGATDFASDIEFLTVADYTFVLNKKVVPEMSPGLTPDYSNEAVFEIRAASPGLEYTLSVDGKSARYKHPNTGNWITTMNAAWGLAYKGTGEVAQFKYASFANLEAFAQYPWSRPAFKGQRPGAGMDRGGAWILNPMMASTATVATGDGTSTANGIEPGPISSSGSSMYMRGRLRGPDGQIHDTYATTAISPSVNHSSGWIRSRVLELFSQAGWSGTAGGQNALDPPEVTVYSCVDNGNSANKWYDGEGNSQPSSYYLVQVELNPNHAGTNGYYPILDDIYWGTLTLGSSDQKGGPGKPTHWWARKKNAIWVQRWDGSEIRASSSDGLGDTAVRGGGGEVSRKDDLPSIAAHGMTMRVSGGKASEHDDYYVKFEQDDANSWGPSGMRLGKGSWKECLAPNSEYAINRFTMPHTLLNAVQAGEADQPEVGTGANQVESGKPYFVFESATWEDRGAGDDTTNPLPAFIGQAIQGMTYHRGRLGFLSGESISLSEAGDPFNFFRRTVVSNLDTDRIDLTARSTDVALLKGAVESQEQLLLFSDNAQFRLDTGGELLSANSASLLQIGRYSTLSDVSPVGLGPVVYYPITRGEWAGVSRLYSEGQANSPTWRTDEATAHIQAYIPADIVEMAGCDLENLLVCLTTSRDTLYLFRYHDAGQERLQAAWFRWDLGAAKVHGMAFVNSTLYLAVEREGVVCLERVRLEDGLLDDQAWYFARMDRRTDNTSCTVIDNGDGSYRVQLPYTVPAGSTLRLLVKHTGGANDGAWLDSSPSTTTAADFTTAINLASEDFFVGLAYEMRHTIGEPYMEAPAGRQTMALLPARWQIRKATLLFSESGPFTVEVTPDKRATDTVTISPEAAGESHEGLATVPVWSRSDGFQFDLVNDTPYPSPFISLEVEGAMHGRSRRIG